jgi:low affinity Fe/Cu permease
VGSPWVFILAVAVIALWALTGPLFGFSDTWQLVINTGTTIITFLMVFVIQNTQNRDAQAIHLKLDELLRVTKEARVDLVDLENLPDEDLHHLHEEFRRLREKHAGLVEDDLRALDREMAVRQEQLGNHPRPCPGRAHPIKQAGLQPIQIKAFLTRCCQRSSLSILSKPISPAWALP